MRTIRLLAIALAMVIFSSCNQQGKPKAEETQAIDEVQITAELVMNNLTSAEKADNWVVLFDGKTIDGWHNWNEDKISGWLVEDGCLVGQGLGGDVGGDIISDRKSVV